MIDFLGGKVVSAALATAVAVTIGGAGGGAAAHRLPASAGFSAAYGCTVPVLGPRSVTVGGVLTAVPARPPAGTATRFRLHITGMDLHSPVTIDSWRATAGIDVAGAHTASFRLRGAGGRIPAHRPIAGDLTGTWVPREPGTVRLRAGDVTLDVHVAVVGDVTVACTPDRPRPVIATLAVAPPGAAVRAARASAHARTADASAHARHVGRRPLTGLLPWHPGHIR